MTNYTTLNIDDKQSGYEMKLHNAGSVEKVRDRMIHSKLITSLLEIADHHSRRLTDHATSDARTAIAARINDTHRIFLRGNPLADICGASRICPRKNHISGKR